MKPDLTAKIFPEGVIISEPVVFSKLTQMQTAHQLRWDAFDHVCTQRKKDKKSHRFYFQFVKSKFIFDHVAKQDPQIK